MTKDDKHSLLSHISATLALGLPLIGSSIAQFSLHLVNTVMVGWYGALPLAALVLGTSAFFIFFILGSGFARAVMPLAAQAKARGDVPEMRRSARMALWISIAYAALTYPIFYNSEPLLLWLGQKPEVAVMAKDYLRMAGLGMLPALGISVLQSWLAALGRTQVALWLTVLAVFGNIALGSLFIFGRAGMPELGVMGAGMSLLIVEIFTLIALCLYAGLLPELRPLQIFRRFWRLDAPALKQVFLLGLPIGLTGVAEASLFQASALMMGWLGAVELGAHGIALEVTAVAFMVHVGLANAATIRVAGFAGMGQARDLRLAALVAIGMSLAVVAVTVVIFLVYAPEIVSLFLDRAKPESSAILSLGISLMAVAALFQTADAMQALALGLLRAIQDTKVPFAIAVVSYWIVGIPTSALFGFTFGYGAVGLWAGLVTGLVVAALALMARFWALAPKAGIARETAL